VASVRGSVPGRTPVLVAIDGRHAATIHVSDPVRATASIAVRELAGMALDVWLVSGDHQQTVDAVAGQVGIRPDHAVGEQLPGDKARFVERLQSEGRRVAMVGDGVNDAPALAIADLGVAVGGGTDVAAESADIVIVAADPRLVRSALLLSKRTMRVVRQNLFWAFGYNVVLIPVAMGVLYPILGIQLNPALAAAAMALSSVTVVTNSLRLRGIEIGPDGSGSAPKQISPTITKETTV
jgi:Cu+-exporting ATPase